MPTYSYACTECGNRFDVVQSFTDDTLTTCDRCSGRLRKLFSPVGVVFKGSGFYHNDSREARKAATDGHRNGHSDRNGHGTSSTGSDDKSGSTEKSATPSSGTSGKGDKSDKSDKPSSSSDSTATAAASKASSASG